jgi:hypothetical protein
MFMGDQEAGDFKQLYQRMRECYVFEKRGTIMLLEQREHYVYRRKNEAEI